MLIFTCGCSSDNSQLTDSVQYAEERTVEEKRQASQKKQRRKPNQALAYICVRTLTMENLYTFLLALTGELSWPDLPLTLFRSVKDCLPCQSYHNFDGKTL